MNTIEIETSAGYELSVTIYEAKEANTILIISSATGVKQAFYTKFAEFVSLQGITVITFDYLGIGLSLKKPIKKLKNTASDWGKIDLEAMIQYAQKHYPNQKLNLLGHSIGGQLIGLAKSSKEANKIILVASQSGYWKFWKGMDRVKMWSNWHLLFPILIPIFGYLPSKKLSGMKNLPKNVAKQWGKWCKSKNYLFDSMPAEDLYYKDIHAKMTALSISDDNFAPKEAVDWLVNKYENTDLKRVHLVPKDYNVQKIGHFGIFREKFKDNLWNLLLKEMER